MIARSLRSRLLLGASAGALMLAGSPASAGGGASNPFARNVDPAAQAARAAAAQATQATSATAASQRALAAFARASAIRQNMDAAQAAARAAAAAAQAKIPNGLGAGGLQVAPGVGTDPSLWIGAKNPTQTTGSDGRTKVDIQQTQQQAILNWQSFNVGQQTDLSFGQGGSNWTVLNRVSDPSADPSRILGTIKAPGTVLIMNRNGVIFGGASQVNTGALVAAAGAMTDDQFLKNGLYSVQSANQYVPSITDALGQVKVEAGAQLSTNAPTSATQGGGYVMLLGGSVENAGSITTPKGQALLAAGDSFLLRPGFGTTANTFSTIRGSEVAPVIAADSLNGTVTNSGEIMAQQGDITLAGRTVTQAGVAIATTSVNQRGTIHLLNSQSDALGSVTLTKDSLTAILPELDSKDTALDSQRDALITASGYNPLAVGQFDDLSPIADRKDQSRVEIVSGNTIDFADGSYTLAQGGQIAATATNRILTETGAWLDVSGVRDVALDVSTNNLLVNVQGNELRDSPVNRDDPDKPLYSAAGDGMWVNVNDLVYVPAGTGGYASDRYYTKGGLLEVSGYLGNAAHTIGEWASVGGTITLQAKEVVAQQGSMFNLAGGSLDYAAGEVRQTLLQGDDGKMYTADNAPAGMHFVSVGKSMQVLHTRWGEQYTETYQNPYAQKSIAVHEDAYTVGRDGGKLVLSAPTVVFAGDIDTEVVQGTYQTAAHPVGVTDGYKLGQGNAALEGQLAIGKLVVDGTQDEYDTDVRIGAPAPLPAAGLADALPDDRQNTAWLDADALSKDHLGGLNVVTAGTIAVDAPLTLADGGELTFAAKTVDVNADITAHGGHVTLGDITHGVFNIATGLDVSWSVANSVGAQVTVAPDAKIDLTGDWTNLFTDPDGQAGLAYVDGGSLRISTTGGITLGKGSLVDVSSGGAVLVDGSMKGGKGGDVYLAANEPADATTLIPPAQQTASLILDGDIHSHGFTGGGTLTLSGSQTIVIGKDSNLASGTLPAGTATGTSVRLSGDVTLPAGSVMPFDYKVIVGTTPVDTPLAADTPIAFGSDGLKTATDWTLPDNVYAIGNNQYLAPGTRIPAGTKLTVLSSATGGNGLPAGFVVPSTVFPGGLPITPVVLASYAAGDVLPAALTLPKGYIVPQGATFAQALPVVPALTIDPKLFQSGFSNYAITSKTGIDVAGGTAIAPVVPVYRFTGSSLAASSGADLAASAPLWTPPTYVADPVKGQLTQRAGASLTLTSSYDFNMGAGSSITVDPTRAVTIQADRQTTIDGTITAPGGTISIAGVPTSLSGALGAFTPTRSVWIGGDATLDAAGRAVIETDQYGRRYGIAPDGGRILIGTDGTDTLGGLNYPALSNAFVVIRPGALLDASGAGATIDVADGPGGQSRAVGIAGDGGKIALGSASGLYLDGTLRAAAGGPGAAGGTLSLAVESAIYDPRLPTSLAPQLVGDIPDAMQVMRTITLVQDRQPSALAADARPGDALAFGEATLGVDQLHVGGFDTLSLYSNDIIQFRGDVNLSLGRSVSLAGAIVGLAPDTPDGHVTIKAPYVSIDGRHDYTGSLGEPYYSPGIGLGYVNGSAAFSSDSSLTVDADLIDLSGTLLLGAHGHHGTGWISWTDETHYVLPPHTDDTTNLAGPDIYDAPGFGHVTFASSGDIRMGNGALTTAGDLTFKAAQVYPLSGAQASVTVGRILPLNDMGGYSGGDPSKFFDPDAVLTIRGNGGAAPAVPDSVFGSLSLTAPNIDQGGVVRAPLGSIIFNYNSNFGLPVDMQVTLRAGSITSASADGLAIPFGGTSDGITYTGADGTLVDLGATYIPSGDGISSKIPTGVSITGSKIVGEAGSLLDLSGGGTLAGAGFLSGRGGSVDVLKTPLVNADPNNPGKASDKIYAIVPGYASDYAPKIASNGAGDPVIGQQITIPEGVPGLKAGTYTLLPSSYALLPGGFRIELTGATSIGDAAVARADGTIVASGTLGIANTAIRDSLPTEIILSPGKTVRAYSQYNEESYADFALAQAATFNSVRPRLPVDGKVLELDFMTPEDGQQSLAFAGTADFSAAKGGLDGSMLIGGYAPLFGGPVPIDITGPGAAPIAGHVSISSDAINAFKADTLIIGGYSEYASNYYANGAGGRIFFLGNQTVSGVNLLDGADVRAGQVFLVGNNVDIAGGATIDTRGLGDNAVDSNLGYLFGNLATEANPNGTSVVAVGNGYYNFLPGFGGGSIGIASGANLLTEGTIAMVTGGTIDMGDVNFGAKYLVVAQDQINAGSDAALAAADKAGVLQSGWTLSQDALDRLLHPSATSGLPALQQLTLTAGNSIALYGNVSLDARGQGGSDVELVLNTPAIYGLGGAGDTASITADTLLWNGVRTAQGFSVTPPIDVYGDKGPPPVIPGGAGTGLGTLALSAKTILFGYDAATSRATDGATLSRTALGFGTVDISASDRVGTNDDGTLAVGLSRDSAGKLQGGDLVITTPLITASRGATMAFSAGGAVKVVAPDGATPVDPATVMDLGGTLSFKGDTVDFDTVAALPSGKLTLDAANDVTIGADARIDLDGRTVNFYDVTQYGWGGDLVLNSASGSIRQAAGSVIDVSAIGSDAGTVNATAANGVVALDGTLKGQGADGHLGGGIAITERTMTDFDGLNAGLDAAGFYGSRGFDIKQGDLVVDKTVKAGTVTIALDGGSLTVDGTIDASGAKPGTIRLAAQGNLTLGQGALLDTHSTTLQVDSYGQAVEASNTGHVELASSGGTVDLASGATIDMRSADGVSRGKLEIDARRLGLGDVAVNAGSGLMIKGAGSVAVSAFRTYDLDGGTVIDQAMLDGFDADSRAFIDASYGSDGKLKGNLQTRLAGLIATGDAFHYRPGVELVSAGDLSTSGDLDLSGYRYGPGTDPAKLGSGEAGKLVVRAAGDVNIKGSVTDGFTPPPATPDSNQWLVPLPSYTPTDVVAPTSNFRLAEDWLVPADDFYFSTIYFIADTKGNGYGPGSIIPAGTEIDVTGQNFLPFMFEAGQPVPSIYTSGTPRPVYAIAPPLAPGSQSWSMSFVAGADTAGADMRALRSHDALGGSGNLVLSDPHFMEGGNTVGVSVVRTGTGDLSLIAGGDFDQQTPYGIYTAGTPIAATGTAANDPYNVDRGVFSDGTLLGANNTDYEASLGDQRMYYVEHGGDVLVSAQGDIEGKEIDGHSTNVGDWLWRQGGVDGQATAWGINLGSYTQAVSVNGGLSLHLAGFDGIGALGGGNVSLLAGGDIGDTGRGVVAAVGATGRVMADGSLAETGGGTLTVKAGGNIGIGGNQFADLRGDTNVSAGDFGQSFGFQFGFSLSDPRPLNSLTPYGAVTVPGAAFAPGDGDVTVRARGDLVMGGILNPGLTSVTGLTESGGPDQGVAWFNLWGERMTVDLFAAGGDLSPFVEANPTKYLPAVFSATAPGGNLYLTPDIGGFSMQLPSPYGSLDLLAGGTIVSPSNREPMGPLSSPISAIATPFHPGWATEQDSFGFWRLTGSNYYSDPQATPETNGGVYLGGPGGGGLPFVFGNSSATDDSAAAADGIRSHIYALNGDIMQLMYGRLFNVTQFIGTQYVTTNYYQAAKPVDILSGGDIVGLSGMILHQDPNDVSTIAAGGDIIYAGTIVQANDPSTGLQTRYAGLTIAGPGTLELTAGRNIYEGSTAAVDSLGPIVTGDKRDGASVVLQAGAGPGTPGVGSVDWDGFAALYLDPANQIGTIDGQTPPLEGSGKVAHSYDSELFAWMKAHYGYTGAQADALAAFRALPDREQRVFLRQIYYAELTAGGREYNDPDSSRFGSYFRGREAIATLFPKEDGYTGDITLFSAALDVGNPNYRIDSGFVHTDFGGDIQLLAPGGSVTVGTEGLSPGAAAGLITQGLGNIDIYAEKSVLLGLSRIMTTFGGDILAWSAEGDINAGRGAKTTVLFTPPKRTYDIYGRVTLAPQVPSTGAGIATLDPIPEVPAGDIDLIAPLGTVDAGEAGIRVSGNINIAALHVLNAANIAVKGTATGIPTAVAVNTNALTSASNAASAVSTEAERLAERARPKPIPTDIPSIVTGRLLGFGDGI